PDLAPGMPGAEEIAGHLSAYGVLAALVWWALRGAGSKAPASWALLITMLYGATDEFHQSFVPGRTMTVEDLVVDLIGASLALLLVSWVHLRWLPGRLMAPARQASGRPSIRFRFPRRVLLAVRRRATER
ncbi:MAG: VanZ family protein, partial [Anaerolineae bacterium]